MASEMGKSYETVKGTHKAKPITMASDAEQKIRGAVAFGARADARVGGFDAKATGGGGVPNGRRRLWRAAEVTPGWHTGPVEPAQGGSSIRVGGEGAAITSCVGSTLRDAQQVEGLGRTVGTMGRCVEKAGSRDQRHGVSPAEGEAAAVERPTATAARDPRRQAPRADAYASQWATARGDRRGERGAGDGGAEACGVRGG